MVTELLVLARVCGFAKLVDRKPSETEETRSNAEAKLHKVSPAWTNHIAIGYFSLTKSNLRSYSLPRCKNISVLKLLCFKLCAFQSTIARAYPELYDMIAHHFFCVRYIAANQIIA
uniref:Uncharacterized protein n=1 Tax=Glossina pallidipes TaxID=7398 RepID=A0A1A9ZU24_GLOPL